MTWSYLKIVCGFCERITDMWITKKLFMYLSLQSALFRIEKRKAVDQELSHRLSHSPSE